MTTHIARDVRFLDAGDQQIAQELLRHLDVIHRIVTQSRISRQNTRVYSTAQHSNVHVINGMCVPCVHRAPKAQCLRT